MTPIPAQLGPAPAVFTNRKNELTELTRFLGEQGGRSTLIVLSGLGGVGKTSLALRWLHDIRDDYRDGQLYVDLRGSAPSAAEVIHPDEVLERHLRALGVAPDRIPRTPDERLTMFRSLTTGKRLIILIENAISAAQVRATLPGPGPNLVVVTTRARLSGLTVDGARFLEVAPFEGADALALLDRMLDSERTSREPEAARSLVKLCGNLPIAVCAAAARLALRPNWPIKRAVGELRDATRRLAMLSVEGDISLQAVFDLSYHGLSDEQAAFYRRLGLHPGPDFGLGAAAAVAGVDEDDAAQMLDHLSGASLVQESPSEERFSFHDLLRLHAADKAESESSDERRKGIIRLTRWYLRSAAAADLVVIPGRWHLGTVYAELKRERSAFGTVAEALDWLEVELPNLLAVLYEAEENGLDEYVWQLCESLWGLFVHRKYYRQWVKTHELGLASARRCQDERAESRMAGALASAFLNLHRFSRVVELCEPMAERERAGGRPLGEALALERLGTAHLGLERPEQAIDYFRRAQSIYKRISQHRGAAIASMSLGDAYRAAGDFEEAVRHLLPARDYFAETGDDYNRAGSLIALARAHLSAGRPEASVGFITEAMRITTHMGADHKHAVARMLMADAVTTLGDHSAARPHLEKALEIFLTLDAPEAETARKLLATLPPP
ncbi:tetratricopeptide repeat protein [Rhizohabitans arisaemae]|uniref:tetratricopeptide repeat protein n=1 Tax=Rhizohabitans arisaemae TaxID=2720610 RepID=UPI0024B19429|nr:tetratricopeptide repeat protein [Rhizohabitans arisaemae]